MVCVHAWAAEQLLPSSSAGRNELHRTWNQEDLEATELHHVRLTNGSTTYTAVLPALGQLEMI
jgi:hypothetical protein